METNYSRDRFKFFLPGARVLTPAEVLRLPNEKVELAKEEGKDGLWLEVECPASCIDEEGHINIPSTVAEQAHGKGLLLRIFCPEGSCEIVQSTDVP